MIEGQARRSGIFLLELMISILFFCIAAAVGLQIFVKSHCISEDAGNLNMAVHKVSSVAEVFRSGTDMEDFLETEYSYYDDSQQTIRVPFDTEWENCEEKDAEYVLLITLGETEQYKTGQFQMKKLAEDETVYEVELKKRISQREAAVNE